ncbi:MAG: FixH family protein [Aestuariivirga sp.]
MKVLTTTKPLTGWHMLMMCVAGFGVVFTVNIYMAVMAVRSWTGLVVEDSYVASQTFDADAASLKKAEALSVSHLLHYENGKLHLSLQGADGKAIATDSVQISIGRPVGEHEDQKLVAVKTADGQFEVATKLGVGAWSGQLSAKLADHTVWRQPFRLIVSGE